MNADLLHDAISALPDDLLEPVDMLRRKKSIPRKSLAALAACACLILGLYALFPGGMKSAGNTGAAAPKDEALGSIMDGITQESSTCDYLSAIVVEVAEDHLIVLPGEILTDIAQPITVQLSALETIPLLKEGQRINLYYKELPSDGHPLIPYRIDIIQE